MLTKSLQEKSFYRFGGNNVPARQGMIRNPGESPKKYLESLSKSDLIAYFQTWIAHVWLYRTTFIPNTSDELNYFNVSALMDEFRNSYINGDWELIPTIEAASLDEMLLAWQILGIGLGDPLKALISDRYSPLEHPPELVRYMFIPHDRLISNYAELLRNAPIPLTLVLLWDGESGHIVNSVCFDDDGAFVFQDDVGEFGKCWLSQGHNQLGIEAEHLGFDSKGHWKWKISGEEFAAVFYGIPMSKTVSSFWNAIALVQNLTDTNGVTFD